MYLEEAQIYPPNLGEGKLFGTQENNIFYYLGSAYEGLGETTPARDWYKRAALSSNEPTFAMFYHDQPPDMIFYQGLARQKLGEAAKAQAIFNKLIDYGEAHLEDEVKIDYFAISLPNFLVFEEDLNLHNQIHCHYLIGLGYLGLREVANAQAQFDKVLELDAHHLGALLHRELLG